ncbi:hypothetical protein [Nocardia nepalensis]|uniref:hypothetical protein n=1 Tax=Nocardia nepalensis TaxID=3375448 RepID=UPI003B66C6BD
MIDAGDVLVCQVVGIFIAKIELSGRTPITSRAGSGFRTAGVVLNENVSFAALCGSTTPKNGSLLGVFAPDPMSP